MTCRELDGGINNPSLVHRRIGDAPAATTEG